MANVQASRFALLKVEDDYDSDEKHSSSANKQQTTKNKQGSKQASTQSQQKKKDKNKVANNNQQPAAAKKGGGKQRIDDEQWDKWATLDDQYVDTQFEKELQEALVTSRLQYEEMKQNRAASNAQNGSSDASGAGKKKKKKDKPVSMSLEQFSQADLNKKSQHDSLEDDESRSKSSFPQAPATTIPAGEGDTEFFNRVDDEAKRELRREHRQQEFKKHYELENAQTTKLKRDMELRDKEIVMLRATNKKLEEELQQVKKRNQQLCHILGQGEMKDKTALLLELDELRQVRDDLTEEVSQLTSDLEKERSKVHLLKTDADKAKGGGKHGGK